MIRTGAMFTRARELDRGVPRYGRTEMATDDIDDLTSDIVTEGLRIFDWRLRSGTGWHPHGGASPRTYLIGACVQAFPNLYRSWLRHRRRIPLTDPVGLTDSSLAAGASVDPEEVVTQMAGALELLRSIPDRTTRAIVVHRAEGFSNAEIAARLCTSERAVEGRLYRARQRLISAGASGARSLSKPEPS
jgi:RNA polymerase sigma-70 factor (ECF subfamily)